MHSAESPAPHTLLSSTNPHSQHITWFSRLHYVVFISCRTGSEKCQTSAAMWLWQRQLLKWHVSNSILSRAAQWLPDCVHLRRMCPPARVNTYMCGIDKSFSMFFLHVDHIDSAIQQLVNLYESDLILLITHTLTQENTGQIKHKSLYTH